MEFITQADLNKYEKIFDDINKRNCELEAFKKKHEETNNKLFALKLKEVNNSIKNKLVNVLIKVFHSLFDLQYLYNEHIPDDELQELAQYKNCKYCLVHIYFFKEFYQKLLQPGWLVNIILQNNNCKIIKSLEVIKINTNPILIVLPFVPSFDNDSVSVSLLWKNENFWNALQSIRYWPKLDIIKIPLNISHYFKTFTLKKPMQSNKQKILKSNALYNKNLTTFLQSPTTQYKLFYKTEFNTFFETIMQNCYHNLDLRSGSVFAKDGNEVTLKLSFERNDDIKIKFNESKHMLSIETCVFTAYLLKKYFIERCNVDITSVALSQIHEKIEVCVFVNIVIDACGKLNCILAVETKIRELQRRCQLRGFVKIVRGAAKYSILLSIVTEPAAQITESMEKIPQCRVTFGKEMCKNYNICNIHL